MADLNHTVRFQVEGGDAVLSTMERVSSGVKAAGADTSAEVSNALAKLGALGQAMDTEAAKAVAKLSQMAGETRAAGDATDGLSAKAERALATWTARLDPTIRETQRFEAGRLSAEDHARYVALLTERYTEAGRAAAEEAAAIEAFRANLDPAATATAALSAETERLNGWLAAGKISAEEHAEGVARLRAEMSDLDATVTSAAGTGRPWFLDSNVTRNWVDVVQVLAASRGDITLAIPTILDAADVTKYYYDQSRRAADEAGESVADMGEAAADMGEAAGAAAPLLSRLSGSAIALGSAVAAVVVGLASFGAAWMVHSDSIEEAERAMRLYGGSLGLTATGLEELAQQAAAAGNISVLAAREMEQAYIATRKIGAEVMSELIELSRDYAAVTDQDVVEATVELADMFSDPAEAAKTLTNRYGLLSAATLDHVQALVTQGQRQEAAIVVADALKARIRGMADETSSFAAAWNRVWATVSNTFDAMGRLPMAESNSAALDRLFQRQRELVQAQGDAAARIAQETGGQDVPADWLPSPAGYVDRSGASVGTAVGAAAAQAATQLEVVNRQVQLLAEQWAAAETARISAEQAAGREAAAVVEALNPALRQLDDYDAMLTKLSAVQGKANADMDDASRQTLAATTERVSAAKADLQAAVDAGKTLDQVKADASEKMYAKAAGMEATARQKYLAEESARIGLIGATATTEERATAVRQAGAQVVSQMTAALADQAAETARAQTAAEAIAAAWQQGTAEGLRMEAVQAAIAEAAAASGNAASAQAAALTGLRTSYGEASTESAKYLASLRDEVTESAALADAAARGQAAYQLEANHQAAIAATRQQINALDALRAQYDVMHAAGLVSEQGYQGALLDLEQKRTDAAAGRQAIEDALNEQTYAEQAKWLGEQIVSQADALALAQAEFTLVGQSEQTRGLILAKLQAENTLKQQGIDLSSEQARQYVAQQIQLEAIRHEIEAAEDMAGSFEDFADDNGEAAVFFQEIIV